MSPDEIHEILAKHYPQLVAEPCRNPDGWSFYLAPRQGGSKPNRIIRATRSRVTAVTKLKLAVSARRGAKGAEFEFTGDESALRSYVEQELQLFKEHFTR
jgi:hypothetical protein